MSKWINDQNIVKIRISTRLRCIIFKLVLNLKIIGIRI